MTAERQVGSVDTVDSAVILPRNRSQGAAMMGGERDVQGRRYGATEIRRPENDRDERGQ